MVPAELLVSVRVCKVDASGILRGEQWSGRLDKVQRPFNPNLLVIPEQRTLLLRSVKL